MPEDQYIYRQQHLADQAETKLNNFMRQLYTTLSTIAEFEMTLTPQQKQLAELVKAELFDLNDSAKNVSLLITELGQFVRVLLRQRQTSKEAFLAGWNGFYRDFMAQLSAEDRDALQPILDSIMRDDNGVIPF